MYLNKNNELKVIALYSGDYRAEFYLRQISRLTKISLKTCQNVLSILEKERVLKGKIEGKNKYFSLNLENIQTKSYLVKAEIYKTDTFLEKYSEFRTFLKSLDTNALIIIFGSFARLNADKYSDLDVFIVSEKEPEIPFHLLPHSIHQNRLNEGSFRKAVRENETLMNEIEEHHIILNNPSGYVNIIWRYYGK